MTTYFKAGDKINLGRMHLHDIYIWEYFRVVKVPDGYIYFIWDDMKEPGGYAEGIFVKETYLNNISTL